MPDTNKLRNLVDDFTFLANPQGKNSSEPCTVGDLRNVIAQVKNLMDEFINELDEAE